MKEFKQILREYGIGGAACEGMEQYAKLLLEENAVHNLTRITAPEEVAVKHFVDAPIPYMRADKGWRARGRRRGRRRLSRARP